MKFFWDNKVPISSFCPREKLSLTSTYRICKLGRWELLPQKYWSADFLLGTQTSLSPQPVLTANGDGCLDMTDAELSASLMLFQDWAHFVHKDVVSALWAAVSVTTTQL